MKWLSYMSPVNLNFGQQDILGVLVLFLTNRMSYYSIQQQKWVILNTYMRGGSTLLGTLFDGNEDAFYWFEPIFNIYASMMAAKVKMHPLRMYYTSQGKPR